MDINAFITTSRRYLETTVRSDKAGCSDKQELSSVFSQDPESITDKSSKCFGNKVKKWKSGNLEIFELDNFEVWICGEVDKWKAQGLPKLDSFDKRV